MDKKARDNRANQMNPNNPAYYKSRMGNSPKKKSKNAKSQEWHGNSSGKYQKPNNQRMPAPKVKVVHHHHHHTHVEREYINANPISQPMTDNSILYRCPYCGREGWIRTRTDGSVVCTYCDSWIGERKNLI